MKAKQIIIAALLMAAIAPIKAQDLSQWRKVNDTTWVRYGENSQGVYSEIGIPVNHAEQLMGINNDLNKYANLETGVLVCGAVAAGCGVWATNRIQHNKSVLAPGVAIGVAGITALVLKVAGIKTLSRQNLYLTPDGVVIKIGKSNKKRFIDVEKQN